MSSNSLLKMEVFLESFYTFRLFLLERCPDFEKGGLKCYPADAHRALALCGARARLGREQRPSESCSPLGSVLKGAEAMSRDLKRRTGGPRGDTQEQVTFVLGFGERVGS